MNDNCILAIFIVDSILVYDQSSYGFNLRLDPKFRVLSKEFDLSIEFCVEFSGVSFAFISFGIKFKNGIQFYPGSV